MPYQYLDHTADLAFRAEAPDLSTLFRECALALLNAMVERPDCVRPAERRKVHVEAQDLDRLLVQFLDEILFYKDAESLLLRPATVTVARRDELWKCTAVLEGEPVDPARHPLGADVKAVTWHGLAVRRDGDRWIAEVTVDV